MYFAYVITASLGTFIHRELRWTTYCPFYISHLGVHFEGYGFPMLNFWHHVTKFFPSHSINSYDCFCWPRVGGWLTTGNMMKIFHSSADIGNCHCYTATTGQDWFGLISTLANVIMIDWSMTEYFMISCGGPSCHTITILWSVGFPCSVCSP